MAKVNYGYALLVGTWLLLLAIILHLWLVQDMEPSIWLLVLLAAISFVPLAARLKIGNWIDFTRQGGQHSVRSECCKGTDT